MKTNRYLCFCLFPRMLDLENLRLSCTIAFSLCQLSCCSYVCCYLFSSLCTCVKGRISLDRWLHNLFFAFPGHWIWNICVSLFMLHSVLFMRLPLSLSMVVYYSLLHSCIVTSLNLICSYPDPTFINFTSLIFVSKSTCSLSCYCSFGFT